MSLQTVQKIYQLGKAAAADKFVSDAEYQAIIDVAMSDDGDVSAREVNAIDYVERLYWAEGTGVTLSTNAYVAYESLPGLPLGIPDDEFIRDNGNEG